MMNIREDLIFESTIKYIFAIVLDIEHINIWA